MLKYAAAAVAALATIMSLAGCAGEEPLETYTADNGDTFNDADVAYATEMVQHHAQALQMVDLTVGRPLDPPFERLADQIRAAQAPEIDLMVGWLAAWDQPVPETVRDHANAHDSEGMDMGSDMPGMMTAEQLSDLEDARGAALQKLWLEMMIEHHQGAVEMAQTEQRDGTFTPAVELAEGIESSQQQEIARMQRMLG